LECSECWDTAGAAKPSASSGAFADAATSNVKFSLSKYNEGSTNFSLSAEKYFSQSFNIHLCTKIHTPNFFLKELSSCCLKVNDEIWNLT